MPSPRRPLPRLAAAGALAAALVAAAAGPAAACAGLIGPGGNVRLVRTATLAAYHDGVEHYVTSFEFEGGGAEFGSIVPLPAVPAKVERGGDWTLQRLERETQPTVLEARAAPAAAGGADAEVVYETRVDALDITILRGGGSEVARWARSRGFTLTPDAPEVLDFYAERSPVFMAARFDPAAAEERGQQVGDGTPVHLTIPTANPWVPLRILGLGRAAEDAVVADVYLLTDRAPALMPRPGSTLALGLRAERSESASDSLLDDLRADKGMEWVPSSMWLTYLRVGEAAGALRYDLAVDASGRDRPSAVAAGLARPAPATAPTTTATPPTAPPPTPAPTTVVPRGTEPPATTAVPTDPPATTAGSDDGDQSAASLPAEPDPDRSPWAGAAGAAAALAAGGAGVAGARRRRRAAR